VQHIIDLKKTKASCAVLFYDMNEKNFKCSLGPQGQGTYQCWVVLRGGLKTVVDSLRKINAFLLHQRSSLLFFISISHFLHLPFTSCFCLSCFYLSFFASISQFSLQAFVSCFLFFCFSLLAIAWLLLLCWLLL
jgi:hypothetical protein